MLTTEACYLTLLQRFPSPLFRVGYVPGFDFVEVSDFATFAVVSVQDGTAVIGCGCRNVRPVAATTVDTLETAVRRFIGTHCCRWNQQNAALDMAFYRIGKSQHTLRGIPRSNQFHKVQL